MELLRDGVFLMNTLGESGVTGGSDTVTLNVDNLPNHNHTFTGSEETGRFHIRSSKHDTINSYYGVFSRNGRGDVVWKTNLMHNSDDIEGCMTYEEVGFKLTPKGSIIRTGKGEPINNLPPYMTCYMYKRIE